MADNTRVPTLSARELCGAERTVKTCPISEHTCEFAALIRLPINMGTSECARSLNAVVAEFWHWVYARILVRIECASEDRSYNKYVSWYVVPFVPH